QRATGYGYSLWELEVFVAGTTPSPTPTPPPTTGPVDFGPNVAIFDPSMSSATIQAKLNSVFATQERNQFGMERNALLFKPGTYSVDANIGFNTQIAGLGFSPDDVTINGYVRAEADWFGDNGTQNFWRFAENMSVTPPDGNNRWAVSQAAPFRRMHVRGQLQLDPRNHGWSSGGFLADSKIDGQVFAGSQQQYMTRNSQIGSWSNCVWNCVFVGVSGAPAQTFPNPPYTTIAQTPVIREKPFLYIDSAGNYQVFVPALRTNASGTTWSGQTPQGTSIPISQFFIVKPGATAADMNNALAQGKNLLITPGVYHLSQTINVTRANTVVLGMGLATLIPDNGIVALKVADVDGVKIAGILIDAGTTNSPILMEVGPPGSSASHAANPTSLHDVFARIGGAVAGKATVSLVINSSNVIIDHTWLWRGDHGSGIGWTVNTADNGLIVNGSNVTAYGLFVEHYQKYNVIWNGNGGRTYMFQNELPYDPPNQASWMNGSGRGYAAYKVANTVTSHEAWGVGSYCYFNVDPSIVADRGFEVPNTAGVRFHNLLTVSLGGNGVITNVINTTGAPAQGTATVPSYVVNYP
ncbi:MAG TPA: coagulation factor 5/8 type domain-containing protein, partial [Herpetosiphonaceae bacterium]